ncbi:hypothetical protein B4U80_05582 [Leptotrombidium deliense]|uniref:Uncharacterized protein n=1 Tax=Leptotrombidium deliense TaxID=299467 RepID=A0A443S616_9ACAR|nr:hypothetical protein B4U80_05582 [Leptotrombidium deliense]
MSTRKLFKFLTNLIKTL